MTFLINCVRCQKRLGIFKRDPEPTWGLDGKICDDCVNYIRNGIAVYNGEYIEGYSKLTSRTEGFLSIHLFDHRNKIFFMTKTDNINLGINGDSLLGYDTVVMNEKSTAKQILTVGLSSSTSKRYLKIQFKDGDKTESLKCNRQISCSSDIMLKL